MSQHALRPAAPRINDLRSDVITRGILETFASEQESKLVAHVDARVCQVEKEVEILDKRVAQRERSKSVNQTHHSGKCIVSLSMPAKSAERVEAVEQWLGQVSPV